MTVDDIKLGVLVTVAVLSVVAIIWLIIIQVRGTAEKGDTGDTGDTGPVVEWYNPSYFNTIWQYQTGSNVYRTEMTGFWVAMDTGTINVNYQQDFVAVNGTAASWVYTGSRTKLFQVHVTMYLNAPDSTYVIVNVGLGLTSSAAPADPPLPPDYKGCNAQ